MLTQTRTFFGWMTLETETFIGVTLMLGLFTRLGAIVALGMAANVTVGILNVSRWRAAARTTGPSKSA